jgi:AraC-like DNA-binding protein
VQLRPYVVCYNELDQSNLPADDLPVQRCLPNGMAELIFTISAKPSVGIIHGSWNAFPAAYLVGIMREPVVWRMGSNGVLFSARIRPEGVYALLGLKPQECFNGFIDLESILSPTRRDIIAHMLETVDTKERIRLMDTFLKKLLNDKRDGDLYLEQALNLLRQAPARTTIESLSRQLAICKRQFERNFKYTFGLSPKAYQRILRFDRVFQYLEAHPGISWVELSYNFGYSDQAHFIREFKSFYGQPPVSATRNP